MNILQYSDIGSEFPSCEGRIRTIDVLDERGNEIARFRMKIDAAWIVDRPGNYESDEDGHWEASFEVHDIQFFDEAGKECSGPQSELLKEIESEFKQYYGL